MLKKKQKKHSPSDNIRYMHMIEEDYDYPKYLNINLVVLEKVSTFA